MTNLIDEVDNHVVLLDTHSVEMFANRKSEVILALAACLSFADHCGRVDADAVGLGQDPLSVRIGEGGRGVQAMLAAVGMENLSIESGPLHLLQK